MGGNALSCASVRLTKENYDRMAAECTEKLRALYPNGQVEVVKAYRSKESHGDLDVLVTSPEYDPVIAAAALGAVEVVRNGPVTSIGVLVRPEVPTRTDNVFQVDLMNMDAPSFEYAASYYAFNDLGNLIGRTAHAVGLAHKHNGLWFSVKDSTYKFRDILLTRDYSNALEFLGYDVVKFNLGFENLDEIFKYVASSEYFNRAIYLFENRNNASRTRDRKRKTYCEFLNFCEESPGLPAFEYPVNKQDWLPRIAEYFPHFQLEYDKALKDLADAREVKAKFNGKSVSEVTGLEGIELGEFMRYLKSSFGSEEEQRDFVLGNSSEEVNAHVRKVFGSR